MGLLPIEAIPASIKICNNFFISMSNMGATVGIIDSSGDIKFHIYFDPIY